MVSNQQITFSNPALMYLHVNDTYTNVIPSHHLGSVKGCKDGSTVLYLHVKTP